MNVIQAQESVAKVFLKKFPTLKLEKRRYNELWFRFDKSWDLEFKINIFDLRNFVGSIEWLRFYKDGYWGYTNTEEVFGSDVPEEFKTFIVCNLDLFCDPPNNGHVPVDYKELLERLERW